MKKVFLSVFFIFLLFAQSSEAQIASNLASASLLLDLQKLNSTGSVLYIAAHPDDENTELLTYLVNERKLRTAYLSLTRGDGGQNLMGPEQGEQIGVIRTQELMAARKVDGAEQLFTRAYDFGYTKNPEEVFKFWNHDSVLADVVWVIRKFRPDVIITRFPTTGEGGHGQHTASAILASEAFDAAADSMRFTSQLKFVKPWQAKRLFTNSFNFGSTNTTHENQLKIIIGEYNPLLGYSYGEIAALSRSMHRCQGMGTALKRDLHTEYFQLLKGKPAIKGLFDDEDLTMNRYAGTQHYAENILQAIKNFNASDPSTIIPSLLNAHQSLIAIQDTNLRNYYRDRLQNLILNCAGYFFEATTTDYSKTPGSNVDVNFSFINRNHSSLYLSRITISALKFDTILSTKEHSTNQNNIRATLLIPSTAPLSTPYWLRYEKKNNLFVVPEQQLISVSETNTSYYADFTFDDGSTRFTVSKPLLYKYVDPMKGEQYRSFEIVPPISLEIKDPNYLSANNAKITVSIVVTANDSNVSGNLYPVIPENWKMESASLEFHLNYKGEKMKGDFELTPLVSATKLSQSKIIAEAIVKGKKYNKQVVHISYDHIPTQVLLKTAEAKLIALPLNNKAKKVAYLKGAGDQVASGLQQMGCQVEFLSADEILNTDLKNYDAVITGIRYFNVEKQAANVDRVLLQYVNDGGTLVCQYNTSNNLVTKQIGPYPFTISDKRVTDEKSPMNCIAPDHPLLNFPNKITEKDFDGWIQERGLYFCTDVDNHYQMLLNCNDIGEEAMGGSLLYCKYGKGNFIYTNLAFFRQLPAGVPGAYRLFANLISAGKE